MSFLSDHRTLLAAALEKDLGIPIVPGLLEGHQSYDRGSLHVGRVQEVPGRVNEQQILSALRVFKQFEPLIQSETPYDPSPLEELVDAIQASIHANETNFGPWFLRVISFTLDLPSQGVEAEILAYSSNFGVGGG